MTGPVFTYFMRTKTYTVADYRKKIKLVKLRGTIFQSLCNVCVLAVFLCMILCVITMFATKREASHTPVLPDMLVSTVEKTPEAQYDTSISTSYVKKGIVYCDVSIGGYTTERSSKELSVFGYDTACDTEIYTLTIENTDQFFLSATVPKSITIVRYSILGDKPFTTKEIEEYEEQAAKYFTYLKYDRLCYEDAASYQTKIQNMAEEKLL